ncbi:hypothetical protein Ancab_002521 [Ancistrocladus abbreviatus]
MDSKKSKKISEIVKLKQMLKKWRKQASSSNNKSNSSSSSNGSENNHLSKSNSIKRIGFLKRTLSLPDNLNSGLSGSIAPKGFLAVQVGEEMKRFIIPTSYLSHQAFGVLLKEAEEEFGFQQEGVLRIPCEVTVFENILKMVEAKNKAKSNQAVEFSRADAIVCGSTENKIPKSHHPQSPMCR